MNIGNYSGISNLPLNKERAAGAVEKRKLAGSMEKLSKRGHTEDSAPVGRARRPFLARIEAIRSRSEGVAYSDIVDGGAKDLLDILNEERGIAQKAQKEPSGFEAFRDAFKTFQEKFQEIIDSTTFEGQQVFSGSFSMSFSFSATVEGAVTPTPLDFSPEKLGLAELGFEGLGDAKEAESVVNRAMVTIENQISFHSAQMFTALAEPGEELGATDLAPGEALQQLISRIREQLTENSGSALLAQGNSSQQNVMGLTE